ncbi:phosphatase PAP2 family protein [Paracrocinitomix mangrovi]|uniref:phosphatase PAP2 family protein n=1 Tax=Paracrocinitomix mangrovi TaxID=2862509 RepID=UPI001C8F0E62|nr:phosphatase PAP2 family protein [Paracrocinitomix mangrovi]UKN00840.1 phosphatase PAP2 family protein [Paracrocinitomix mangrovi]
MRQIFSIISYLFHPFLMPLLGLFLLFETYTLPFSIYKLDALYYFPGQAKQVLYVVLGILTCIAPGLSLLIMYWNKLISSLEMEDRKERTYPFILVTFYFILAYIYLKLSIPEAYQHPALMSYFFGIILTFAVSFVINFYVKLSLHAAAAFGVCGMLLAYYQTQLDSNLNVILIAIPLAGLVAGSRVYLKAHTFAETVLGMIVGFGVLYSVVKLQLYI